MIRVWNIESGDVVHEFPLGERPGDGEHSQVRCVRFSQDGTRLMAARNDELLRVFDLATGEEIHTYDAPSQIYDAVFNSVDSNQAVALWGTSVKFWNPETDAIEIRKDSGGHAVTMALDAPIISVARRTGGDSDPSECYAKIIHYQSSADPVTLDSGVSVLDIAVSRNGRFAVTTLQTPKGESRLWDVAAQEVIYEFAPEVATVVGVDLSPDGRLAATTHESDKSIRIWRLPEIVRREGGYFRRATQNFALQFDGVDDYVDIPSLRYDGTHPVTIEAYVIPAESNTGRAADIVSYGSRMNIAQHYRFWGADVVPRRNSRYFVNSRDAIQTEDLQRMTHIAMVYDGDEPRIYRDGQLLETDGQWSVSDSTEFSLPALPSSPGFVTKIASSSSGTSRAMFHGIIDEVRISNVARYTEDFTPERRFEPDEHTLALYHFDEGEGETLVDSSGNGHHGEIRGATWVRVGELGRNAKGETDESEEAD